LSRKCVLYLLVNPFKRLPFYVGIGNARRPYDHFREADSPKRSFKLFTIRQLRSAGVADRAMLVILADGLMPEEAAYAEQVLIGEWGRRGLDAGGVLTNRALGGDLGAPEFSRAVQLRDWADPIKRAKRIESIKESFRNPEKAARHRAIGLLAYEKWGHKMRAAMVNPTPEVKEKIRAGALRGSMAAKAALSDPEKLASISKRRKELWADPVYRAKVSAARKAKWQDPEFRRKNLAGRARQRDAA
jgi:hypothetical protein